MAKRTGCHRWSECTPESHAALKLDDRTWAAAIEDERPWPAAGLIIAECRACGSTLARRPAQLEAHVEPAPVV